MAKRSREESEMNPDLRIKLRRYLNEDGRYFWQAQPGKIEKYDGLEPKRKYLREQKRMNHQTKKKKKSAKIKRK